MKQEFLNQDKIEVDKPFGFWFEYKGPVETKKCTNCAVCPNGYEEIVFGYGNKLFIRKAPIWKRLIKTLLIRPLYWFGVKFMKGYKMVSVVVDQLKNYLIYLRSLGKTLMTFVVKLNNLWRK